MPFINEIILEICKENNITAQIFCDGYCLKLSKNNNQTYIYDNIFEMNDSAVYKILKDKSAVYEILNNKNIPCVKHFYFYANSPTDKDTQKHLEKLLKTYKNLVLKYNEGMSGKDVYKICNSYDLKTKSQLILSKYNSLTASPFYEINHEYRVVMLNGEAKLIFDKVRPFVVGNGVDSIKALCAKKYQNKINIDKEIDKNMVPKADEKIILSWRHNLKFGANPEQVTDKAITQKLSQLSKIACKELNIKFATVDIIETANGELMILEINGSVTMGKFANFSKENLTLAKEIYAQVLSELLD